jgi:hypothetical protein
VTRRTGDALALVGGAALVVSAFLPWVRRGPGHSLRGHDLIDAIVGLGRSVPALTSARLTVVWYLIPALGAASWITVGLLGAHGRATRAVALGAAAVVALALAAFVLLAGAADLGIGAGAALAGALALAAGAFGTRGRAEN